jgi:hypothetical protein
MEGNGSIILNKNLDTSHSSPVDGFWNVRFHEVRFEIFTFLGLDPLLILLFDVALT